MAWYISNLLYRSIDNSDSALLKSMPPVQDNPPPYDSSKSAYSYLVDKLIDSTTSRFGYLLPSRSVDKKSLLQGVKLVEIAVDEFETGNEAIGLDVYLAGLDKIIMALPNLKEMKTKEALKERLTSLEGRVGISTQQSLNQQEINTLDNDDDQVDTIVGKVCTIANLIAPTWLIAMSEGKRETVNHMNTSVVIASQDAPIQKFKILNSAITDIIVRCVVLFKQSPVPGLLHSLFSYFVYMILWINEQFHFTKKIENMTVECIKFALKTDEKYRLHEFASEAVYTVISAFLKAIIAYKEAPLYKDTTQVITTRSDA